MSTCHVVVSRVPVAEERGDFLLYELSRGVLLREVSDYLRALRVVRHYAELTIEQGAYHLAEFWTYLHQQDLELRAVSDRVLEGFRDQNYEKVLRSSKHRGVREDAQATVNLKLLRIYDWLAWLQLDERLTAGTVGRRAPVTVYAESPPAQRGRGGRWIRGERKYPLLFRVPDANAKHDAPARVVTDRELSGLFEHFHARFSPYLAARNIVFADVADTAGWRRGSICSLTVDQFNLDAIEKAREEFLVRPSRQKFGYNKTFAISLALAYRVRQFIDEELLPWLQLNAIPKSVHQERIFLSSRTGQPMTDRSMTQIISRGFRELGFDRGVGPHALRSKFASDEHDHELAERQKLGLDTSNRSLAAASAMKMGHNDPTQMYRYASAAQARQARIAREGRLAELERLREENVQLRTALEQLQARAV